MEISLKSGHLYAYVQDLKSQRGPFKLAKRDFGDPPHIPPTFPAIEILEKLISKNEDVWLMLLDNPFCSKGYNSSGDDFNPIFQSYAKQDYRYLIEYVRFVTYRYLQHPTSHSAAGLREMVEHLPGEMKYVDDFFDICVGHMEIDEQELLDERSSPPVLGYTAWEQISAMTDDVFSNYVRMIPCFVGWNRIAQKLRDGGPGVEDTYFYQYWYSYSIDDTYAKELLKYLEDNLNSYNCEANWEKWHIAFRQACLFEIAFFAAALDKNLPNV